MTTNFGYPPTGLPSGSSQSAGTFLSGENQLANGVVVPGTLPSAPNAPAAPVISTDLQGNSVKVSLSAVPAHNGAPITEWQILRSDGKSFYVNSLPATIPAVANQAVTVQIRAKNAFDWSTYSPASNSVTPVQISNAPGQPAAPVATAGNAQVGATWIPPASSGSAPITNYRLSWSGGQTAVFGNILTGSVTGVTNGVAGTLTVAASNDGGVSYGPESLPSNSVTPAASGIALQQTSPRIGAPSSGVTNTNNYAQFNQFSVVRNNLDVAVNKIRFKFVNAVIDASDGTMRPGPALTAFSVGLSAPGALTGARTLLTFGGSTTPALAAGEEIWSDELILGTDWPANVAARMAINLNYASAPPRLPNTNINSVDNANELSEGAVSGLASKAASGTLAIARIGPKVLFGPNAMVATPVSQPTYKSWFGVGDSIGSGADDTNSSQNVIGFLQRALQATGMPWAVATQEGYALNTMFGRGTVPNPNALRFSLTAANGATHCVCELSINDLRSGRTPAQIISDMNLLKAALTPMGVTKLIVMTPFPNTNASNNAEASGATGIWAKIQTLCGLIRDGNGIGDGYFDANDFCVTTRGDNTWRADLYSGDGTHPSTAQHNALNTALQAYLATVV